MNLNDFNKLIQSKTKEQLIQEFSTNKSIIITKATHNDVSFRPMQCYANYNYVGSLFLGEEE
jgi:hypothetical protein